MNDLLEHARSWVSDVHPHARHLLRTEAWVLELEPAAGEGLRLAAVLHDIERAFPEPDAGWESWRDWDSPAYNRWHQDRCADIAARWLREQGAAEELAVEVDALIRVHEDGGWREADVLQAADSLSFLETMIPLVSSWPHERADSKLRNAVDRIAPGLERAPALAGPLLDRALEAVSRERAAR